MELVEGLTVHTGCPPDPAVATAGITPRMTLCGRLQWDLARARHVAQPALGAQVTRWKGGWTAQGVLPEHSRVIKIPLAGAARGEAVTMACATRRTLSWH